MVIQLRESFIQIITDKKTIFGYNQIDTLIIEKNATYQNLENTKMLYTLVRKEKYILYPDMHHMKTKIIHTEAPLQNDEIQ